MLISPFRNRRTIFILPLLAVVCVLLFLHYGIIPGSDSSSYLSASIRVSPLYPSLLALLRLLFGMSRYLNVLGVLQCLLLAYGIFSLTVFLGEQFSLSVPLTLLCAAAFLFLYLLRLFLAGPEALYCVTIMTEALTYPVYYLFFKYAFAAWSGQNPKHLLTAGILAFVLALTRGQLISMFPVMIVLFFVLLSGMRRNGAKAPVLRKFAFAGVTFAVCYFAGTAALSGLYHFVASGAFTTTTMGKEAVLGAVLYSSDAEDLDRFDQNEQTLILLRGALEESEAEGITYRGAGKGVLKRFRHYEQSHDELRDNVVNHVSSKCGLSRNGPECRLIVVSMADRYLPGLLQANISRYLGNCLVNGFGGIIRSNSILNRPGIAWGLFLYADAIVFILFSKLKNRYKKERQLLLLVLVSICMNALFCSFGVFELSRYVYYNFPCFYLALFLSAYRLIRRDRSADHS